MSIASAPTPPVAPVTMTGPLAGARPLSSMRTMPSAAVKPAVPSAIASKRSSPAGSGTTQPAGTRAYSA